MFDCRAAERCAAAEEKGAPSDNLNREGVSYYRTVLVTIIE
jgi:hypothetical protein